MSSGLLKTGLTAPVAAALFAVFAGALPALAAGPEEEDVWPILQRDVFNSREIVSGTGVVSLEAPDRAEDAALTPLTVRIPAEHAANATRLTILIDKNPSPVVAEFTFGPAAGNGERMISTRVRVDAYTDIRAVVETADGKLHMAAKFVKAAGGCSAPALKDPDAVLAEIGRMQVKSLGEASSSGMREGLLMIKHPQYSGLQKNQLTGYWILAKYITNMEVKRGGETIFTMTGGISISEDPNIRFTYAGAADETIEVTAKDTDERVMKGSSVPKGS
jgi:sulfur-oxidizing protein SoxY